MTDVPDDLTTEGTHRGNEPPEDTGRTVRSPEGPDPSTGSAQETPALFQVMRAADDADRSGFRIRTHPPRRVVEDADDGYEEVAQVHTPDSLREVLGDLPEGPYHVVFEVHDDGEVYVEHDAALDHPWLFKPRYDLATLFPTADAASAYAEGLGES